MRHRTREIQFKRGLGPDPNKPSVNSVLGMNYGDDGSKNSKELGDMKILKMDEFDPDDEPDTLDTSYIDKFQAIKVQRKCINII